ncbi:MAG: cysteine dioxygenase [Planctomycetota bacterium]
MGGIATFADCVGELTHMVETRTGAEARVLGALDIIERTLRTRDQLDLSRFVPGTSSYARHLIHCDPNNRFCLLALVWKPGQGTPIHDHPSWGVYGVVRNQMRFVNYIVQRDGDRDRLTMTGAAVTHEGSALTIFPPWADVHRMENPSPDQVSVTLHCYGVEIKEFNIYQLETAARRPSTTKYDSVPG